MEGRRPLDYIDNYGVTFDHLISADTLDPEVLAINIIEVDNIGGVYADGGKYVSDVLPFSLNTEFLHIYCTAGCSLHILCHHHIRASGALQGSIVV
ncbi:hypothetical protein EJ04DRAFT_597272 [Polyplosphaeria fusca]|uniref:Uncharacterized protein n=1 Tax=Polyplosphaeria fusca TaxID=682080 RepID=A0A9P4R4C1_9PLEO|nr:hypothetical protein EJ04DRAFT_597272 [Polyplosphaeria fusca]